MKIYTRMYNTLYASIPYALPALLVPKLKKTCFAIPFPTEGILEAIAVEQVSTDRIQVYATVELLCSSIPFPAGDYAFSTAPASSLAHYRVLPTPLNVLPGMTAVMDDQDYGRAFKNVDGTHTVNQRYIYLLIEPAEYAGAQLATHGADIDTNWNVTLRCRTDIG